MGITLHQFLILLLQNLGNNQNLKHVWHIVILFILSIESQEIINILIIDYTIVILENYSYNPLRFCCINYR